MMLAVNKIYDALETVHLELRPKQGTYTAIFAGLMITGLVALGVTWLVMRLSLKVVNYVLKGMPTLRRKLRPWLRKRGLNFLPSRRRLAGDGQQAEMKGANEILEIAPRHQTRLLSFGSAIFVWGKRAIAVGITVAIFYYILKPIHENWDRVRQPILEIRWLTAFAIPAGMFAIFLFVFRALVWRRILVSFGYRVPVAAATRIWSTSEFARYLPGAIWQVVGRVYLIKPYGVSGSVCGITQVLELAIFLLANILVALTCLLYFGIKNFQGPARTWFYVAVAMVPLLLFLLHTKIFYGIINRVMTRLGKPPVVTRLRGHWLIGLLFWNIFGLLWQSLAIFIIVRDPLGLTKWDWWWVVAGAYCLAWCAGFLAFWAPGGIGVREIVFMGIMTVILPPAAKQRLNDPAALAALLAFLSVLLRLWATTGEFILAAIAYTLDIRGALGDPTAPGRVPISDPQISAQPASAHASP
jgi:hypothetical protein